jgi:hypothetical protein
MSRCRQLAPQVPVLAAHMGASVDLKGGIAF